MVVHVSHTTISICCVDTVHTLLVAVILHGVPFNVLCIVPYSSHIDVSCNCSVGEEFTVS